MDKTEFITSYNQYWELANDDEKEITSEVMVSEDVLLVTWHLKNEANSDPGTTSVAIASYVTAYARMMLYDLMEKIECISPGALLYHDTDSAIFVHRNGEEEIPLGDFLGDLTSEIPDGSKCIKYVSLGPKCYGIEIQKPDGEIETTLKIKGLSLTEAALDVISFKEMVRMAVEYTKGNKIEHSVPQQQFISTSQHMIYTRQFEKVFRAVSEKRCVKDNYTLPFGYIK
jgi:hypothetical protein